MTPARELAARLRIAVDYTRNIDGPTIEISQKATFWDDVFLLCDEIDRLQTATKENDNAP